MVILVQMKNRAKCKLCQSIIESFHPTDYVLCKCGEISVDGGDALRCAAKDFRNFLRVDDEGHEIIVTVKSEDVNPLYTDEKPMDREEKIKMLDDLIKSYDNLPTHAMTAPITNYEFSAFLTLLSSILRS